MILKVLKPHLRVTLLRTPFIVWMDIINSNDYGSYLFYFFNVFILFILYSTFTIDSTWHDVLVCLLINPISCDTIMHCTHYEILCITMTSFHICKDLNEG
jgi:hypothetical protein